ncbi:MAG: hypothetical protein QOD24_3447 [Solirubrobacteraceae bacterium]|nr:hypothetical protein [Solirubrobacteraceae bacterium]
MLLALLALLFVPAQSSAKTLTVTARELAGNAPLASFTYLVNVDNTRDPRDPNPLKRTLMAPTESNSPVVAKGDQDSPTTVDLPAGRYLISVRSPGHKLWGKYVTVAAGAGDVPVDVALGSGTNLPLGKIKVFVFEDSHFTNSQPDEGERGLAGFHVTLTEGTNSQVSVDYNGAPLCGGDCVTDADGSVTIDNLGPATYTAYVTPPTGSGWIQTSSTLGGFGITTGVTEGSDGSGIPAGRLQLFLPPGQRTSTTFGFVEPKTFSGTATGSISGTARNWLGYPPFDNLVFGDPVQNPIVALSDRSNDEQVYTATGDADGNFTIPNVPAGEYTMAIWDEQLNYIIRLVDVTVASGQQVDVHDVGVARWFGWLSGSIYRDLNGNSVRDPGEPGIPNTDLDQRWRDGSIKESTFTDAVGRYEYPQVEGGNFGKWFIGEVGFSRFKTNGASLHDEFNYNSVTTVPQAMGGGLLTNQYAIEGHRSEVDWGKEPYPSGTPGQIVGIAYWGTTRNEFDARLQAHEDYEPGIPGVTVQLESVGVDSIPNTSDDILLNTYVTDKWQSPTDCAVRDFQGNPVGGLNPFLTPNCIEVPAIGNQTKDGAFDGGYAFADYCPPSSPPGGGPQVSTYDPATEGCTGGNDPVPLVPGKYITHVLMPKDTAGHHLYKIVAEEDVNVDLGNTFVPQIPPPACVGDTHVVPADSIDTNPRGPYAGKSRPFCDKRLVELQAQQNANSDFFLMTNFKTGPDVQIPGRVFGLVPNDVTFERDKQAPWYGEPAGVKHVPVGVYDYKDRLLTTVVTDDNGAYEVLLPSTETLNCPIPQGPCPGEYVFVINDPGSKAHPNPEFNPDYQTSQYSDAVWPGQMSQFDTPVTPIAAQACSLPVDTPELLEVSRAVVPASDTTAASRRITIHGDFFGTAPGTVTLTDVSGAPVRTLGPAINANPAAAAGGIVSWDNRTIVIQVPATSLTFAPHPKQLAVRTAAGVGTTNGVYIHVLNTGYNPNVVNVAAPSVPHALQNAIDAAPVNSLLLLQPGTYRENIILNKRLKLQGRGPGGIVGSNEVGGRAPDDARANIAGTVLDGRFFADDKAYWTAKLASISAAAPAGIQGVDATHPALGGAAILVVAKTTGTYAATDPHDAAWIDGLGVTTGRGEGAGGIQLMGSADNVRITNDVFQNNGGVTAGAIGIGQPYRTLSAATRNTNVKILFDRLIGNGALARGGGGVGIFGGSNDYEVAATVLCSNYALEYGAGISHWGRSPGGRIHDNKIYYNEGSGAAGSSGAGISISEEILQPVGSNPPPLGTGSGAVDIDRNLIQANNAGDDGGGIFVKRAQGAQVNIRNNMIVDNLAGDVGGGIMLVDSRNVSIVNNTVASNVTSASSEGTDDQPHGAGLASAANSPEWQATLGPNAKEWSDPVDLFNNVFWQNEAFTLTSHAVGATLVSRGFMDFEIKGVVAPPANPRFTPRFSLLTTAYGTGNGNIVGQDPLFVTPATPDLSVIGSRLDPQVAAVTITGFNTPLDVPGNFHLTTGSPAIDRGPALLAGTLAPTIDYDRESRPVSRSTRPNKWDLGADEVR